jgi:hypothetical protein
MQVVNAKDCPKGEFVKRQSNAKKVYIRGEYNREKKAYSFTDFEDINREIFVAGWTTVYIGFDF